MDDVYPPVPPLCQCQVAPDSALMMCHPNPISIVSLILNVGTLVSSSSLFAASNCANPNFDKSSTVDKIPPALTNAPKSQLEVTSPTVSNPRTSCFSTSVRCVVVLVILYREKIFSLSSD